MNIIIYDIMVVHYYESEKKKNRTMQNRSGPNLSNSIETQSVYKAIRFEIINVYVFAKTIP